MCDKKQRCLSNYKAGEQEWKRSLFPNFVAWTFKNSTTPWRDADMAV